jgi:hypothetical protein
MYEDDEMDEDGAGLRPPSLPDETFDLMEEDLAAEPEPRGSVSDVIGRYDNGQGEFDMAGAIDAYLGWKW